MSKILTLNMTLPTQIGQNVPTFIYWSSPINLKRLITKYKSLPNLNKIYITFLMISFASIFRVYLSFFTRVLQNYNSYVTLLLYIYLFVCNDPM